MVDKKPNPVIFRTNSVIFRTNTVMLRTNPVIIRTHAAIFRTTLDIYFIRNRRKKTDRNKQKPTETEINGLKWTEWDRKGK